MGHQTRGVSIVGTANITIEVDAAAARAFAEASPGEQQKLQLLLSLRLQELTAKQGSYRGIKPASGERASSWPCTSA